MRVKLHLQPSSPVCARVQGRSSEESKNSEFKLDFPGHSDSIFMEVENTLDLTAYYLDL